MMDWSLIAVPFVLMALLCPLMMVGMIVGGWLFARGRSGSESHGMMMCHGGHDHGRGEGEGMQAEMRAQREGIDRLVARSGAAADEALTDREPQPD
jgi:hypothetical protein